MVKKDKTKQENENISFQDNTLTQDGTLVQENIEQNQNTEVTSQNTTSLEDKPEEEKNEQDPLILAQQEAQEWKDKYIRLLAEFENYKKRIRQERLEWQKTGIVELIKKLLPILDDFERGLKNMQSTEDKQLEVFKNGYELIYNKLLNTLKQYGLETIDEITDFNTDLHEAIQMIEDPERKGKVVEIIEKGYKLEGKVIRFAKVIVAN
jgi:molecular chaperone GrpE